MRKDCKSYLGLINKADTLYIKYLLYIFTLLRVIIEIIQRVILYRLLHWPIEYYKYVVDFHEIFLLPCVPDICPEHIFLKDIKSISPPEIWHST